MNSATFAVNSRLQVLLLLAVGRKTARPAFSPNPLPFKSTSEAPHLVPLRRRVPIVAWQIESWEKEIVAGRLRPGSAEKVRLLRLKKS